MGGIRFVVKFVIWLDVFEWARSEVAEMEMTGCVLVIGPLLTPELDICFDALLLVRPKVGFELLLTPDPWIGFEVLLTDTLPEPEPQRPLTLLEEDNIVDVVPLDG